MPLPPKKPFSPEQRKKNNVFDVKWPFPLPAKDVKVYPTITAALKASQQANPEKSNIVFKHPHQEGYTLEYIQPGSAWPDNYGHMVLNVTNRPQPHGPSNPTAMKKETPKETQGNTSLKLGSAFPGTVLWRRDKDPKSGIHTLQYQQDAGSGAPLSEILTEIQSNEIRFPEGAPNFRALAAQFRVSPVTLFQHRYGPNYNAQEVIADFIAAHKSDYYFQELLQLVKGEAKGKNIDDILEKAAHYVEKQIWQPVHAAIEKIQGKKGQKGTPSKTTPHQKPQSTTSSPSPPAEYRTQSQIAEEVQRALKAPHPTMVRDIIRDLGHYPPSLSEFAVNLWPADIQTTAVDSAWEFVMDFALPALSSISYDRDYLAWHKAHFDTTSDSKDSPPPAAASEIETRYHILAGSTPLSSRFIYHFGEYLLRLFKFKGEFDKDVWIKELIELAWGVFQANLDSLFSLKTGKSVESTPPKGPPLAPEDIARYWAIFKGLKFHTKQKMPENPVIDKAFFEDHAVRLIQGVRYFYLEKTVGVSESAANNIGLLLRRGMAFLLAHPSYTFPEPPIQEKAKGKSKEPIELTPPIQEAVAEHMDQIQQVQGLLLKAAGLFREFMAARKPLKIDTSMKSSDAQKATALGLYLCAQALIAHFGHEEGVGFPAKFGWFLECFFGIRPATNHTALPPQKPANSKKTTTKKPTTSKKSTAKKTESESTSQNGSETVNMALMEEETIFTNKEVPPTIPSQPPRQPEEEETTPLLDQSSDLDDNNAVQAATAYERCTDLILQEGLYAPLFLSPPLGIAPVKYSVEHRTMRLNFGYLGRPAKDMGKKYQTRKDRLKQIRDLFNNDSTFVEQHYLTECLSHLVPPPKDGPLAGKYTTKRLKFVANGNVLQAVDLSVPIPDMDFATFKALSLNLLDSLEKFSTKKPADPATVSDGYALGKKLAALGNSRDQFKITPSFSSLLARVMRLIVGSYAYRGSKKEQKFEPKDLAEKLKAYWKDVVAVYAAAFASTFQINDVRGSFITREYKTLQKRIETEARLLQFKLNKLLGEKLYTLKPAPANQFMGIFDPSVLPPLSALSTQLPSLSLTNEPPAQIDKQFAKFQHFLELAERQPREETFIRWLQAQTGIRDKIKALFQKTKPVTTTTGKAKGKTSTMKFGMTTPQALSDQEFTLANTAGAFLSLLKEQCPSGELKNDTFNLAAFSQYFHRPSPFRWWDVYRRVSLALARLMMVHIGKSYTNSNYAKNLLDYYHFSGFCDAMDDFQNHIRAFEANQSRFLALDEEIGAQIRAIDVTFQTQLAVNKNLVWNNPQFQQLALVPVEKNHFSPLIAAPMVKSARSAFAYMHEYFSQIESHFRVIKSWALALAAVCMNNEIAAPQPHIANLFNVADRLIQGFGEYAKKPMIAFATSADSIKIIMEATGMASLLDFSKFADEPAGIPPLNKFKYNPDHLPLTNLVQAAIWALLWELPPDLREKIHTSAENFDKFNYIEKIAAEIQTVRKKLFYFVWKAVSDPSDGEKLSIEKQTIFQSISTIDELSQFRVSFRNLCGDPRFQPLFDTDEASVSRVVMHKPSYDAGLPSPDPDQLAKLGQLKYLRKIWFAEFRVMRFYQTLTSPLKGIGDSPTAIAKSIATKATGVLLGLPVRDIINHIPREAVQYWKQFHCVSAKPAPAASQPALEAMDTLDSILDSGNPAKLAYLVKRVTFWDAGGNMVDEPNVFNQLAKLNTTTDDQKITHHTLTQGVSDYAAQQYKTMSLAMMAAQVLRDNKTYPITEPEKYVSRIKENLAAWRESGRHTSFKQTDFAQIQARSIKPALDLIASNDFIDLMPLIDQASALISSGDNAESGDADDLGEGINENDNEEGDSVESLMDEEDAQAEVTPTPLVAAASSGSVGLTVSDLTLFIQKSTATDDDIRDISQKIAAFLAIAPQTVKILSFLASPVSSGTSTYFEVCAKKIMLNSNATIPRYHEKVLQFTTRRDMDRLFLIKTAHQTKSTITHYYILYKILLDNGVYMVLCDRVKHKPDSDFPLFAKLKLLFECLDKNLYWTNFNNYRAPLAYALQKFCSMVDGHAKITQLFLPSEKSFYNFPISWFNFMTAKGLLRQVRGLFLEFWGEIQGEPKADELRGRFQEIMDLVDAMIIEPKPYRKGDDNQKRYVFYRDMQQLLRILFLTAASQRPISLGEKEFGVSASDLADDGITIPLEESETVMAAFKVNPGSSIFYHIKRFSQSPRLRDSLISACGQLAFISAIHYLRITALSYAEKYQLDLANVSLNGKQKNLWELPLTEFVRQFLALREGSPKLCKAMASPSQEVSPRGTFATALSYFQFIFHELSLGLFDGKKPLNKRDKIFSDFLDVQKFQIMPNGKIVGMFSWKEIVPKFTSGFPELLVASNDLGLRDPSTPAESSELFEENQQFHKNKINLVQEFAKECQPAAATILKKTGDQHSPMRPVARANYILRNGLNLGFAKQRRRNQITSRQTNYGRSGFSQNRARHVLRLGNASSQMARRQSNANIVYGHVLAKATVDHARFAIWRLFTQGSPAPPDVLSDFDYAAPPLKGGLPTRFKDSLGAINGKFNTDKDIKEWAEIFSSMPARVLNSLARLNFENLRNYRGGGMSFALQKNSWLRGKFLQYAEETAALRGVHAFTYVPPAYTSKKAFETGQEGVVGYLAVQTENVVFRTSRDTSISGPQYLVIDELNIAHQGGALFAALMKLREAINAVITPAGFSDFDAFKGVCQTAIRALEKDPTAARLFPDGEWTDVVNWDLTRRHCTRLKIHAANMEKKIKDFQQRHIKNLAIGQSLGLVIALLSQIGFIVWGAATIYKVLKFLINTHAIEKRNFNIIYLPAKDGNQISYYTGDSLLAKVGIGASASKVDESIINTVGDIVQNLDFTSLYGILSTTLCYGIGAAGGVTSKIKDANDDFNSDALYFLGRDPNASANIGGYNAFTTTGENLLLNLTRLKSVIDPDEPERSHNQVFLRSGMGKLLQHLVKAAQLHLGETRFQDKSFLYDAIPKRDKKALAATVQAVLPYLPAMPRTDSAASLVFPDVVQEFQRTLPTTFNSEAAFPDSSIGLPEAIPQIYIMFWEWIAAIFNNQILLKSPVPPVARLRQLLLPPSIYIKPLKDYWTTPESGIGITDWTSEDNTPIAPEAVFTGPLQPLGSVISVLLQANHIPLTKNHLIDFVKSFGTQPEMAWKDLKGAFLGTIQRDKVVELGEIFAFMAAYRSWG
jgi:hypothetical protein